MPKNETQAPAITEPQAATLQELKALAGADNDFIVEQLDAGATLAAAQAVLMQRLNARVEELTKENQSLRNATPEPQPQPEPAPVAPAAAETPQPPTQPVNVGVQPITSSSAPNGGGSDSSGKPWGGDPFAFFHAQLSAKARTGLGMKAAIDAIYAENTGLKEAMKATVGT